MSDGRVNARFTPLPGGSFLSSISAFQLASSTALAERHQAESVDPVSQVSARSQGSSDNLVRPPHLEHFIGPLPMEQLVPAQTQDPIQPSPDEELPDWAGLLLDPLSAESVEESPVPSATMDAGREIHEVRPQDNLSWIALLYGRSEDELALVNPSLFPPEGNPDLITPGQEVVIFDDERTRLVTEQYRALEEGEDPRPFIEQEMVYATRDAATPADILGELKEELKARWPENDTFATAVDDAGKSVTLLWDAQGRTHAVFEPIYRWADDISPIGFMQFGREVRDQYTALAETTPTIEAIKQHEKMLLKYGPQDEVWQDAIKAQTEEFLNERPRRAAQEIADAYNGATGEQGDPSGAYLAARKLRELTDPDKIDPLTAARILSEANSTVISISSDFIDPTQSLWYDKPEHGVTGEYGEIYSNLSAAADSAARSPEGQASIETMAFTLKAHGAPSINARGPASEGHTTLSLAIASELRMNSDDDNADRIVSEVLDGVSDLEGRARDAVTELGNTAAPLLVPSTEWAEFLPEGEEPTDWFNDQDVLKDVEDKLDALDPLGYQLTRAYAGVAEYAPQLTGSSHHQKLLELGPDEDDEKLSLVLNASRGGLLETTRLMNLEGLDDGSFGNPNDIVINWSWPAREARNTSLSLIESTTGHKPTGVGLSLYGAGTYIWGVDNKLEDGRGSHLDAILLYGAGAATEGTHAIGRALAHHWGLTDAGNNRAENMVWNIAQKQGTFGKLFNFHLKALDAWFVYSTINAAAQGDWAGAALLGGATGGSAIASSMRLQNFLKLGRLGGPVGNGLILLGSLGLTLKDNMERVALATATEPYQEDYLAAAGIDPEVAGALARNDENGLSVAGRLAALAEYRGTTPEAVLEYLAGQNPRDVFDLTYAAVDVKPGNDGNYPAGEPSGYWTNKPDIKADFRPANLAELNQFVEHYMPGFPGG